MAKDRGFQVVATDMDPDAEGFAFVDRAGIVSTRDVESTVAFAREIARDIGLHAVMTMASESGYTVAQVAAELDLPGLKPAAAWRAAQKVERQRAFQAAGVPSPRFASARNLLEARRAAQELGWPVVVKPADSAGSRGVRKVSGIGDLQAAVSEAKEFSSQEDPEILLEEFLQGSEHSIEGLVLGGEIRWTGFSDRNYDKKEIYPPYFLEDGDTLPSDLSPEVVEQVMAAADQAVRALRIDQGPVKGDILVDENGPKVIEMAARLSGDYFCYETVPLHNGTDLLRAVMDQALGLPVDQRLLEPKYERGVALRYVWPEPGVVREIRGVEEVRSRPGVRFFNWEPRWREIGPGTEITPARSMGERVGSVLAHASTRAAAVRIAEEAVTSIQIRTELC